MSEAEEPTNSVASLTVQLLSAYLANNTVASEDIAGLIRSTREALTGEPGAMAEAEPETFTPAVSVRKSLASPEHIISLIDGKPYKTLKRHLMARGLTPEEYRIRYNLPANYPMVAPAYAEHRRAVAQRIGLGARKSTAGETPTSKDDQLDAVAPVEPEVPALQSAPEPEKKPRGAVVAKKSVGARAARRTAPIEKAAAETAFDLTPAEQLGTPAEALAPDEQASPASKARSPKSRKAKAPDSGRSKAKARLVSDAPPPIAASSEAARGAADEQDGQALVQSPKRRPKLGVFKKRDADAGVAADAAGAAAPSLPKAQVTEGSADVSAPAKRKSSKRMARSAVASDDSQ